jgi:hypothetical protein
MNDPRSPSLLQVMRAVVARQLADVHTAIPARVESYDKDKQTVDVQPLVQARVPKEGGGFVVESLPVLAAIPVCFPAAGGMRLVLPIAKGDTGQVIFSEASLDAWQAKGGLVDPGDTRRFHLSDGVFYPGLHANDKPLTVESGDDASFGKDGAHQVVITASAIELGGNGNDRPTDYVTLDQKVQQELSRIKTYMTALDTVLRVPINEPGNGAPSAFQTAISGALSAVTYPSPNSMAASKVKAK